MPFAWIHTRVRVYNHVVGACRIDGGLLDQQQQMVIKIAALLHDVDDEKFFEKQPVKYHNAKVILNEVVCDQQFIDDVCECISFVSSSVNKDMIPTPASTNPHLL
ncbi:hypothetical protein ACJMK2_002645 [Sinanodonta woodiana]|uniref:HD domain-containing protein n=1 Tax=Sinanodonta woodiana TaxID=1069815 RepID=A0ABD3XVY6_SINWO